MGRLTTSLLGPEFFEGFRNVEPLGLDAGKAPSEIALSRDLLLQQGLFGVGVRCRRREPFLETFRFGIERGHFPLEFFPPVG